MGLSAIALALPGRDGRGVHDNSIVVIALVCASAFQFSVLLTDKPALYLSDASPAGLQSFQQGVAAAAVLTGVSAGRLSKAGRMACVAALLLVYFALGVWLIRASPNPHIDVFVFQRDAVDQLLQGKNPYRFPSANIYGSDDAYGPGMSVDGQLKFGFPYPPLNFLLGIPGAALAGDPRYSQLLALTITGACMAAASWSRVGSLVAALYLFTPRSFFMLEQAWTESYAVFLLVLLMWSTLHWAKLTPWLLGLVLTVKQYLALLFPLAWLLVPRTRPRGPALIGFGLRVALSGAVLLVWFALLKPLAFWRSVVLVHSLQPFRPDSFSYPALWVHEGSEIPNAAWGFVAASLAIVLALWRAPRTAAGFAGALGLSVLCFFAYGKQAFSNYYFFVIGAVCSALAFSVRAARD
ncbi:MAG TPA: hypothetical protein VJR89_02175 [Polyangiales bacterium]|nr:hypothetical protein [Polyangiales bacterium]